MNEAVSRLQRQYRLGGSIAALEAKKKFLAGQRNNTLSADCDYFLIG
jgi:hypothetical protein